MLSLVRASIVVVDDRCCCCFCCPRPPLSLVLSMIPTFSLEVIVVVEVSCTEFFASFMAVPERYDMKPGSIGRIHGDRKEASPAALVSNTILFHTTLR